MCQAYLLPVQAAIREEMDYDEIFAESINSMYVKTNIKNSN